MTKAEKQFKFLSTCIFIMYFIIIIWIITFKCNLVQSITDTYLFFKEMTVIERINFHLVPFKDYIEGPFLSQIKTIIEDDILNILFFVPLGMYASLFIKKHKFIKVILFSFLLSLFFEIFQLFSLIGSFSTKDLITNVLGSIIGYFIYRLMYKKENSQLKLKVYNVISTIVVVILIFICVYAIYNTILNIDLYIGVIKRTL